MLTFRHEELIEDPEEVLPTVAEHLGVEPEPSWVKACESVLFEAPQKSRHRVEWTKRQISDVEKRIEKRPELLGYTFED